MNTILSDILAHLNKRPIIAGTISDGKHILDLSKIAFHSGADIIELRIDSFSHKERQNFHLLLPEMRKHVPLPIIATVRASKEQDPRLPSYDLSDPERKRIYETVIPLVEFIDVELNADRINGELIHCAHRHHKKVILSFHDFKSVPGNEKIKKMAEKFKKLHGDILKIAAAPKDKSEAEKFMRVCQSLSPIKRIFIAMGKPGMISRITSFSYGSCMTYGYVDRTTASGQLSVKDLVKYCQFYYPVYSAALLNRKRLRK